MLLQWLAQEIRSDLHTHEPLSFLGSKCNVIRSAKELASSGTVASAGLAELRQTSEGSSSTGVRSNLVVAEPTPEWELQRWCRAEEVQMQIGSQLIAPQGIDDATTVSASEFHATPNAPRPRIVVVPVDFSESSVAALSAAESFTGGGAVTHALYVGRGSDVRCKNSLSRIRLHSYLEEHGFRTVTAVVQSGRPASQICAYAGATNADLIVIASHQDRGVRRWLTGSVSEHVIREAPCFVLVLPGKQKRQAAVLQPPLNRVVVAIDFSPGCLSTLDAAATLVAETERLHAVYVRKPSPSHEGFHFDAPAEQRNRGWNQRLREYLERHGRSHLVGATLWIVEGDPVLEILRFSEQRDADLIVVGSHQRSDAHCPGRIAEKIIHNASSAVLVVRGTPGH